MRKQIVFCIHANYMEIYEGVPDHWVEAWAIGSLYPDGRKYRTNRWAGNHTHIPQVMELDKMDPYEVDIKIITDVNTKSACLYDFKKMIEAIPEINWQYAHSVVIMPFIANSHAEFSSWLIMGHKDGNSCLLSIEHTIMACHRYLAAREQLGDVILALSTTDRVKLVDDGDWAVARLQHD